MSDVVIVSEGYVTSETDNDIPENLKTVDEIVKFLGKKKVYRVRYKRTLPKWLQSDEEERDAMLKKFKEDDFNCTGQGPSEGAKSRKGEDKENLDDNSDNSRRDQSSSNNENQQTEKMEKNQ